MWWRLCLAAAPLFLGCCAATDQLVVTADMLIIPEVPAFQEQARRDDCASVALASLLGQRGVVVAPAAIDAAVYDPRLRGALLADLEHFAAEAGAKPRAGRGSLAELRRLLSSGIPVLVPIDLGWGPWRRPHYVVLFGFNKESFVLHMRAREIISMTDTEFERRWTPMGRLWLYLER